MGEWKKLFYYLLLNIIVSALTSAVVLFIWDSTRPAELRSGLIPMSDLLAPSNIELSTLSTETAGTLAKTISTQPPTQNNQASIVPTTDGKNPSGIGTMSIEAVIGAGDLATERVMIKRTGGDGEISLADWKLQGSDGKEFVFPTLMLYPSGAVNINTRSGTNTVIDLFWNRNEAAWRPGATITLLDPQNNIQVAYKIP